MPELLINFTAIADVTSYEVCYKPVTDLDYTCIVVSSLPVIITENIICGTRYDVKVTTNCPASSFSSTQSSVVTTITNVLDCPIACLSYTLATSSASGTTSSYIDCEGIDQTITLGGVSGYDASTICAQENSVVPGGEVTVTMNGPCTEGAIINSVTAGAGLEPCIGGTIDDHMGASIYLDNNVTVDTDFDIVVYYVDVNANCSGTRMQQNFTVTVLAGNSYGDVDACTRGAYFPSGAQVCETVVTGYSNNTVDTINI
jgi:hypothetical protein